MRILMMTNTYLPYVGGVARSVEAFTSIYRERGYDTLVVAPTFEHMPAHEENVQRVPAIQRFNGSDFSVALPISTALGARLDRFEPDIVHAHHPFLLGATALRVAHTRDIPLIFTHHTMYEQYTHYVPGDSEALKRAVIGLSTDYANLCQRVIAPSESIAEVLVSRGVTAPVEVVPTGVDLSRFSFGSGDGFRACLGIDEDAYVIGHLGRLAPEKNLEFLVDAVIVCLEKTPNAHFMVVGVGPSRELISESFAAVGLSNRLHLLGILEQPLLASAYAAMDVFAFSSRSETQGMVLTEAMAMGTPVVALDAPGVREVVDDSNGCLLPDAHTVQFADVLVELGTGDGSRRRALGIGARKTAERFSLERCADKALALYAAAIEAHGHHEPHVLDAWDKTLRLIEAEWVLLKNTAHAAGTALLS